MNKKIFNKIIKRPNPTIDQQCEKDYFTSYYKKVIEEMENIQKEFPLLKMVLSPTTRPSLISLQGWLVSRELLNIRGSDYDDWIEDTIYIKAIFPTYFHDNGIRIFDYYKMINKTKIEQEFLHFYDDGSFCTHFSKAIKHYKHKALECLKSAESLVMEYKRYEKTGQFRLDTYPHDANQAQQKYNKDKKKYEKLRRNGRI